MWEKDKDEKRHVSGKDIDLYSRKVARKKRLKGRGGLERGKCEQLQVRQNK